MSFINKNHFFKKNFNSIYLNYYSNNCTITTITSFKFKKLIFFPNSSFNKLTILLNTLFLNNKNILFVDYNFNYNYLPVNNINFFSRSTKYLHKLLVYFNVGAVIFLNLNKKFFLIKKLHKFRHINISVNSKPSNSSFDISVNLPDTQLMHYLIYVYVLNIYLKIKNNNLNINDAALFFFKYTYLYY